MIVINAQRRGRRAQKGGFMIAICAQISIVLLFIAVVAILMGQRSIQRAEQQAQADALSVAASRIAMTEGLDEIRDCSHPIFQDREFIDSNVHGAQQGEAVADCPNVEIIDQEDGTSRVRVTTRVSGRFQSAFGWLQPDVVDYDEESFVELPHDEIDVAQAEPPQLVIVMDYSGSMGAGMPGGGTRIQALRRAVEGLLDRQLRVSYGAVLFNSGVIDDVGIDFNNQQNDIRNAIQRGEGGGTAYGGPLDRAVDMLLGAGDRRNVLFVSDGRPGDGNAGISAAQEAREDHDVQIFTLGVGAAVGEFRNTLIRMSGKKGDPGQPGGNEAYHFEAGNDAELQETFDRILADLLCRIPPLEPAPPEGAEVHALIRDRDGSERGLEHRNGNLNPDDENGPHDYYQWLPDTQEFRLSTKLCKEIVEEGSELITRYGRPALIDQL